MSSKPESAVASATAEKPTKVMSWEEFYKTTDDANKLMNRVWYCIACSKSDVAEQKIFWEHWFWKEGEEKKNLSEATAKNPKEACNHTYTLTHDDKKEVDWPIWPLEFAPEQFKMYPTIQLCCCELHPFGLNMQPVAFPKDDSPVQFRVDYCELMGKPEYFIFVLDPRISEEDMAKEFAKLETENGVKREWFHYIKWDKNYEIGSGGEPDINPKKIR